MRNMGAIRGCRSFAFQWRSGGRGGKKRQRRRAGVCTEAIDDTRARYDAEEREEGVRIGRLPAELLDRRWFLGNWGCPLSQKAHGKQG